jgi:hypothetical protein
VGRIKDFPGLLNIQVSSERRSYLLFAKEKYSSYVMVQWNSDPASKCVSVRQQAALPSVYMLSNNVAIRLYKGTEVMFLMTLLYSQIKTATTMGAMFCNTLHKRMITHCPLQLQDDFLIFPKNRLRG